MSPASLAELVDERASGRHGGEVLYSFIEEKQHWTFADLARRAARTAGHLRRGGVGHQDHVGVFCASRPAFIDGFFGLQHLGAIPVPIGVTGRPDGEAWMTMLRRRCLTLHISSLITDPGLVESCQRAVPDVRVLTVDGSTGPEEPSGSPGEIAFIQPSSGTTGEPRGIVLTHHAVLTNLAAMRDAEDLGDWCIGVTWLPFFHDMGLIGTVLNPLFSAFHCNIWDHKLFILRPMKWLSLLTELRATVAMLPPFAMETLTRSVRKGRAASGVDLSRVRCLLVSSEQIRPRVIQEFARTFSELGLRPNAIAPAYGLAEAVLGVTVTPVGSGPAQVTIEGAPAIACGSPLPGVELRLAPDNELLVRTPSVMQGYLDDEAATAHALRDGWLHTGDIAELTPQGPVILGRAKEMLNRNGLRIPPEDLETVVATVDGIRPDRVVAVADTMAAREQVVVLAESAAQGTDRDELVLAMRAELADAGVPADIVDLVPRGFLRRTTSGKVRRRASLEVYQALRHEAERHGSEPAMSGGSR